MNLLAIDTSTENISLCLVRKGKVVADFNRRLKFGASLLIEFIEKNIKKTGLSLADFDFFVLGSGPGSFTGLRISFSVIKAFMLAKKKPAILLGSFYSCAYPFKDTHSKIAVISDARRSLIYLSRFKSKKGNLSKDGKERLITLDELIKERGDHFFITYDSYLREKILNCDSSINFCPKDIYPRASFLMPLAEEKYRSGKFTGLEGLQPVYLHPKTCQIRR